MTVPGHSGLPVFRNDSHCARCGAGYGIWVMFCRTCKEAPDVGDHYHRECRCGEQWVERCGDPGNTGDRNLAS
jgi:hypothetical protein